MKLNHRNYNKCLSDSKMINVLKVAEFTGGKPPSYILKRRNAKGQDGSAVGEDNRLLLLVIAQIYEGYKPDDHN